MKLSKISNPYEFAKVIYYYVLQLRGVIKKFVDCLYKIKTP